MGPCPRCGQQTEADAGFCPACDGYASPATVYSYAPARLEQSREEGPAPRLSALPVSERFTSGLAWEAPAESFTALDFRDDGRRSGRRIALAATLGVVLIAAAAVGVVLASQHAVTSNPKATAASRAPVHAPHTTASAPPAGLVRVLPAAEGTPYLGAVLPFLNSYFTAINQHDYAGYEALFGPTATAESAAAFSAGYGTTTDSAITVESIGAIGAGELVAQVSFVSHQQPDASPTNSSCTAWTISLYLLGQGGSYQLQQPPAGYQPSFAACS